MPSPPFPSEIFGMFIEALAEDQDSLRACSLVSSVFRHLCGPILYRKIALNREEKVDTFIQFGERSDILRYVKSFTITIMKAPHGILDRISRKAFLEILCIHWALFRPETLTAPLLSRLGTVTVLTLKRCRFREFEDFVSFIRCFPLCKMLHLHGCAWTRHTGAKLDPAGRLPVHDITLAHLEVTNDFGPGWGRDYCDQGDIVGASRVMAGSHYSKVFHVCDRR